MGRVALELEKHLSPGVTGIWKFMSLHDIIQQGYPSIELFVQDMQKTYPLKLVQAGGGQRIESGVVFTNDPLRAKGVITALIVPA
jgi:hypothetical protein